MGGGVICGTIARDCNLTLTITLTLTLTLTLIRSPPLPIAPQLRDRAEVQDAAISRAEIAAEIAPARLRESVSLPQIGRRRRT